MNSDFEKELKDMAKRSKIKESDKLKEKVKLTYKNLNREEKIYTKGKNFKKVIGSVAALIACILTFTICFPTYAQEIPGIKQAMNFLNSRFKLDGYTENSKEVLFSTKAGKYTLNIESVYYDGIEISVFYNITGEDKLDLSSRYWFESKIELDKRSSIEYGLENGDFIDDNTFAGMITFYMKPHDGSVLPETLNGTMDIEKINIQNTRSENKDIESSSIEVNSEPFILSLDSKNTVIKEYDINEEIAFEDNNINIVGARKYPTGIFIDRIIGDEIISENNRKLDLSYILWDSKKGELKGIGGQDRDDDITSFKYELPSENGDVHIVPYVNYYYGEFNLHEDRNDRYLVENGKKYDFGNYGTMEIKNIVDKDNETLITVKTTGYQSMHRFQLVDKEVKEYYSPRYEENKNILGILEMETTYVFNKLDLDKDYYIQVPKDDEKSDFKVLTDKIIKLDLN